MDARYTIDTDPATQLIRLRLAGQWDETTLAAYRRDLAAAMRAFAAGGGRRGEYRLLVDLREQGVQPKEIAAGQQAIIADYSPLARRRALVMSPSALHAMQVRRISPEPDVHIFPSEEDALAWLME